MWGATLSRASGFACHGAIPLLQFARMFNVCILWKSA
jgi:hypothetical protein